MLLLPFQCSHNEIFIVKGCFRKAKSFYFPRVSPSGVPHCTVGYPPLPASLQGLSWPTWLRDLQKKKQHNTVGLGHACCICFACKGRRQKGYKSLMLSDVPQSSNEAAAVLCTTVQSPRHRTNVGTRGLSLVVP